MADDKSFQGTRIRRLRRERNLTQARMAADLGISTGYLNLIERNQRPLTARVLFRLSEVYGLDLKTFAGDEEGHLLAGLNEVFSDPLLQAYRIGQQDLKDLVSSNADAAGAILALYHAYREAGAGSAELAERIATQESTSTSEVPRFPAEEVRDFLRARSNYFPELEAEAEALHARAGLSRDELFAGLRTYLRRALGMTVNIVPVDVMPTTLRRFDRHRNRVLLSEMLSESGRTFQLAFQLAILEASALLDRLAADSRFVSDEARRLCRITLASYFAGAVMMPYERFLTSAESTRYDIDILSQRFRASFEQVCHRLTTLHRPGARGVSFFLIRVDNAGNVTKRFSATSFHFARLGGACPRWNVHDAFQRPGKIMTQVIQMPDGATYFSIARTVSRTGMGAGSPEQQFAIGLGCELSAADRVVYADSYNLVSQSIVTPIGVNCRLCPREDCSQRALPPINRPLIVTEHRRDISPFSFVTD